MKYMYQEETSLNEIAQTGKHQWAGGGNARQ
jgi:hypothetical protein